MTRYIDADALIAEFEWIQSQKSRLNRAETEDVIERIRNAPKEDVAPVRHGHWIKLWFDDEDRLFGVGPSDYKCSACGGIVFSRALQSGLYCPECGAKMDEEEGGTV